MKARANTPTRPTHLPDYAELCLRALAEQQLGDKISLGGAFALLHYLDYRSTYDVDEWWQLEITTQARQQVIDVLSSTLQTYGQVRVRRWGDVVSLELDTVKRKVFSFQIAERSAQLEPSVSAEWISVSLDALSDLVANKMIALVERGAPRDFRDIHAVCQARLVTIQECWQLWQKCQQATGQDTDQERAKLAIETHLERIEQNRPLAQISNAEECAQAQAVRQWYREDFLRANMD